VLAKSVDLSHGTHGVTDTRNETDETIGARAQYKPPHT
jgi:hypothetical protein